MFPKSHRTRAFFLYQIFGTLADCLKQMTILIISIIGWQYTYVLCGSIGICASIAGMLIISEPPNSLRLKIEEEDKISDSARRSRDSIIT